MSDINKKLIKDEILKRLGESPMSSRELSNSLAGDNGTLRFAVAGVIDELENIGSKTRPIDPVVKRAHKRGEENGNQVIFYLASQEETLVENGFLSRTEHNLPTIFEMGSLDEIKRLLTSGYKER